MHSIGKYQLKPTIVVSGGAQTKYHDETEHCGKVAFEMAEKIGEEIAKRGCILATGATTGLPYSAAVGAKKKKGFVVGLSPAISEREHVKKYRLPVDYHDLIIYTGSGYAGRNLLLTRVGDAVIVVCGHMGTLNEFTIAFEEKKPIGILEGPWDTDEMIRDVIGKTRRGPGKIIYSSNPKELVEKVLEAVAKEKVTNHRFSEQKNN